MVWNLNVSLSLLQKKANTFMLFLDDDFAINEEEESESN
jgi:hypothetical protein